MHMVDIGDNLNGSTHEWCVKTLDCPSLPEITSCLAPVAVQGNASAGALPVTGSSTSLPP